MKLVYPTQTYDVPQTLANTSKRLKDINEMKLDEFEDFVSVWIEGRMYTLEYNYLHDALVYFGIDTKPLYAKIRQECIEREQKEIVEFLEQNFDNIDWEYVCINKNIPQWFFEKYIDKVVWKEMSGNAGMSQKFFEDHLPNVDWYNLSANSAMSEEFLERNLDKTNKYQLFKNKSISMAFIKRHMDIIDWYTVCQNPNITEEFIEENADNVSWFALVRNPAIKPSCFERHPDKIVAFPTIARNTGLPWSFYERNMELISDQEELLRTHGNVEHYMATCDNPDWRFVSAVMSEEMAKQNPDKVDWNYLSENTKISEAYFERNINKLNWSCISRNSNITLEFFKRHRDKIRWPMFCMAIKPNLNRYKNKYGFNWL